MKFGIEVDKIKDHYYATLHRFNDNGSTNAIDTFEAIDAKTKREAYDYARNKYSELRGHWISQTPLKRDSTGHVTDL